MTISLPPTRDEPTGPCVYFMVRVSYRNLEFPGALEVLSGLVERLGTGEKRPFGSAAELTELITSWSSPDPS